MRKGSKKRVTAFLLAMFMVFSTMGNASLTVAASGNAPVDVTTETTGESDVAQTEDGSEGTTGSEENETGAVSTVGTEEETEQSSVINEAQTAEDGTSSEDKDEDASSVTETEEQPEETSVVTTETETVTETVTEIENVVETTVEETVTEIELFEEVGEGEVTGPYYGDVFEGSYDASLYIDSDKMSTFSDEALLEIINYRKEQELRFNRISIDYPYVEGNLQGSVSKEVWNGLCDLLDDKYASLNFSFIEEPDEESSGDKIRRSWDCWVPSKTEATVIFDVDWTAKEAGAGVELKFPNTSFPAEDVEAEIYFSVNSSQYDTVKAAFAEGTQAILYQNGNIVRDCLCSLSRYPESAIYFDIKDINDLTKDAVYVLNAKSYTGNISNDPNGDEYLLEIYREKADGTLYTDDELLEMLQWNVDTYGRIFTSIYYHDTIEPETASRVLSGKVANATRNIMPVDNPYTISYYTRGDSVSGDSVSNIFDVYMHEPEENFAPEEDATVSYNLTVSGQEAKFSFDAPDYKVSQLQMRVFFEKGTEKANALEMLFGENVHNKHFWIADQGVMYDSDYNGVMLTFLDVKDLERNKVYTIKETQEETVDAPGTIINSGRRQLKVSAQEIGAEIWERGSIAANLAAYKRAIASGKIAAFDEITIIQKEQDNNVIYKEDYNFLLGLLRTYNNPSVYFEFNGTRETRWEFNQPAKASADITANVSYEAAQVSGGMITMKIAQTTYPAKFTDVSCRTSRNSELGRLFEQSFGEVTSSVYNKRIAVVTSLGNVEDVYAQNAVYHMDDSPELAENLTLAVGGLGKYGKKEFYLLPVNTYKETFAIGKPGGYQLETSKIPDGNVTWKTYNSYYATITEDGILSPIRETEGEDNYIMFWAGYKSGEQDITEVYMGDVERRVADMKFSNGSLEQPLIMELPALAEENPKPVTDILHWVSYPTETRIAADELQWSVEGTAVELTVSGNDIGKIKAVSPGEAIVTATYTKAPGISASAKVIVKPSVWDEINNVDIDVMAVSGIHSTLKDLNNQLEEGFAWADPDMSLTGFSDSVKVPVIYTAKDGRTQQCDVEIEILSFDNMSIEMSGSDSGNLDNGSAVLGGEKIYFNNLVGINSRKPVSVDTFNTDENYKDKYQLSVVADAKTKNLVKASDKVEKGQYMFESSAASSGKKVFGFEMKVSDVSGNVLGVVSKGSTSVTITKNQLMNWNNVAISRQVSGQTLGLDVIAASDEKGQLIVTQPAANSFKLTAKSLDNAVCKITKTAVEGEKTYIDYEVKKGGRVYIQLTAADDAKSKLTVKFNAEDIMPKAEKNAVTIDKARKDVSASVKWQLYTGTSVGEVGTVLPYTINGKESTDFTVKVVNTANSKAEVQVSINDTAIKTIKNGKHKLKLQVPVAYSEAVYGKPFETEIVVTVKDTKPVATIKQSKKVNLLYSNDKASGVFTIVPKGDWTIADIRLENQSDTKKCDYVLQINGNKILVALKNGGDPKNTKGRLVITTNEYAEKKIEKNITIATETKKPALVFNKKTETLYTKFYDNNEKPDASVKVIDKATQTALTAYELQVKEGKNWVDIETDSDHTYESKKNTYTIKHKDGILTLTLNTDKKATDKFKFRVKQSDWADNYYVELSYTIKVDTSNPKLVAGSNTLTLNKNQNIYESQLAKTKLTLKGGDNHFDENFSVSVEGVGTTDETVKNKYLNFSFEDGEIKVTFNDSDKDLATGKYKYDVWLESDNTRSVYTTLTINIVDEKPQKCVIVKGKGKIDILDRTGTSLTYTVKTSNLQGRLVGASLAGQDGKKFRVDGGVNEGKIVVKACENTAFSTKVTYKVVPVLVFENGDGLTYTVKADVQKIKVKQGRPKVTITTADGVQNVLYRDRDNKLTLDVSAALGKTPVAIKAIKLVNYTSDLDVTPILENGELKGMVLSQKDEKQILASGKAWNLKFNVYFKDGAGNEKVTQVTYKLIVK